MTISIRMGSVTYTPNEADLAAHQALGRGGIDFRTIRIQDVLAPTGDLAQFMGTFSYPADIPGHFPQTEEEVVIQFNGTTIFGGVVEEMERQIKGFNRVDVTFRCRDYTKWADQKLVFGNFTDLDAGNMFTTVVNDFTTGFTTANVQTGATILPKSWEYVPVSEALQEIAEIVDYIWFIDANRDFHFLPSSDADNKAPLETYNVDTEQGVGNLRITTSTDGLQNSLIVKDFSIRSPNIFFEPGNDAFPSGNVGEELTDNQDRVDISFTPYDLSEMTFELNETPGSDTWVSKTPQWDVTSVTPGAADTNTDVVYVYPGRKNEKARVRWVFTHATGSHIRISYRPILGNPWPEISREVLSIEEFSRRETAGGRSSDGIYERLINFEDLLFSGTDPIQALLEFSSLILRYRGWPRIEGSFETDSTRFTGWRAGQVLEITSEALNIFDLGKWVREGRPDVPAGVAFARVKQPVMVWITSLETEVLNFDLLKYTIEFSNIPLGV